MFKFVGVLLLALVSACSSNHRGVLNDAVKTPPPNDIQLAEVKSSPEQYLDTLVRWGGEVVKSEEIKTDQGGEFIRLEILQRDLNDRAKPLTSESSDGRFVAYIPQPEKKMNSLKDHLVTVVGLISNTESMQLNATNSVTLPVLESKDYYVWHQYKDNRHHDTDVHFRLIFGSPHFWFGHGHRHGYRYHPHGHHLHVHGPYCRH